MRVLVVVPTYNEAENIEGLLQALLGLEIGVDIIVVDDASPDGTAERARQLGSARVRVLVRSGKLGLGSAQRAGMTAGIEGGYDRVVVMDADGSHAPESVPALVAATESADVAMGSRYIPGGGVENWAWHRRFLSKGANTMARLCLGREVHDWTGSFRCYRTDMLKTLRLERFRSNGYAFAEEILFECRFHGFTTQEVPILFVERRAGRSKIDRSEFFAAVWRLFVMTLKRLKGP